jgi:hypothetical protein
LKFFGKNNIGAKAARKMLMKFTIALLHLLIFGKASPYLHNGTMSVIDDNGQVRERSK